MPCFTTTELEEWSRAGQDLEQLTLIKNVAGIFYAGTEAFDASFNT